MLPPASAAIFTHSLFHSQCAPGSRRGGIQRQPAPATRPEDLDARIIAIVDAAAAHEDPRFTATRKTAELLAVFAALDVAATRALHVRVRHPNSADPVARALSGVGLDRRAVLVQFLGRHRTFR